MGKLDGRLDRIEKAAGMTGTKVVFLFPHNGETKEHCWARYYPSQPYPKEGENATIILVMWMGNEIAASHSPGGKHAA